MDENGNDGGRTAMERLARMLGECVLSCNDSAASWAEAHGIDCDDVLYTVIKGNARSDIKRRIEDARGEDECTHTYPERELKRMTGMYLDGRRCTRGEVNEMVDAVEGWKAKAAELDALCIELGTDDGDEALFVARELLDEHYELKELRGAGRVAPEGCRWPRFGDGYPLALGGEAYGRDGERLRVVAVTHRGKAAVRPWWRTDGRGARWVPLSSLAHERPDSWGRLREDVRKDYTAYWGCIGFCCDKCPALVDGKKPNERYDTAGCHTAEQLDILARAERLAGVRDDG